MHMKVADEDFAVGYRFISVLMCVSQNGLLSSSAGAGAQIKIDRHALPGSRRCIVQSVVVCLRPRFGDTPMPNFVREAVGVVTLSMIRLPHTDGKRVFAILAIIHVTQVHFIFTGKKELVRRREKSERSASGLDNAQTIARAQPHEIGGVRSAAEVVLLPRPRRVPPSAAGARPTRRAV